MEGSADYRIKFLRLFSIVGWVGLRFNKRTGGGRGRRFVFIYVLSAGPSPPLRPPVSSSGAPPPPPPQGRYGQGWQVAGS
jgi:hypothetical protein